MMVLERYRKWCFRGIAVGAILTGAAVLCPTVAAISAWSYRPTRPAGAQQREHMRDESEVTRRAACRDPFTLEDLTAQPLHDVSQCPVYSWAGPRAIPQNTRQLLRN